MWGIIPAAGVGSRIQPLAFSKELLPVGSRLDGQMERPRAVSEYLIERMSRAGADKICLVISPLKADIIAYYGAGNGQVSFTYVVQQRALGLCDAIFRALPLISEAEPVLVGLPDTIWFPADALATLPDDGLTFLLFPVQHPELFDAVVTNDQGEVLAIDVKATPARSQWIWGAFKLPGGVLRELHALWCKRDRRDQYIGTLVNAYLEQGSRAYGVRMGQAYVDVGTINGYREAMELLRSHSSGETHDGTARAADTRT